MHISTAKTSVLSRTPCDGGMEMELSMGEGHTMELLERVVPAVTAITVE